MSGSESGAIQSLRKNAELRVGAGTMFKKNARYLNGALAVRSFDKEDARLIERATAKKKEILKNRLLVVLETIVVVLMVLRFFLS